MISQRKLRMSVYSYIGHSVALLEARDRVGGRTWTAEIDGKSYTRLEY